MKVKNSAIIYTGYTYQTLQGVKILADWLSSPATYARVAFEADEDNAEIPTGIDDIVCERPDGVVDFWQVKFTPSPEKAENSFNWEWLLAVSGKTERSRSILRKIYDAILKVDESKLGQVILLSNKVPDRKMEDSLKGNKFNFDKIDATTQKQITDQLGDEKAARYLFSKLTVQHSDKNYLVLRNSVEAELIKYSDQAGVERLINRSREWAMFRDTPSENGWIYLHHLRELLSLQRPDPIPELFAVPEDYCVPDISFHEQILDKIKNSSGETITLTGSPGSGKSTYLSFLCEKLDELKIPLIRHHYFLSLGDSTTDRLSPRVVAESLLYQINSFHNKANADTSRPEGLSEALKQCASYYKSKGVPFVVLIDGLDHVWRDNGKNKKPLEEIFKQILPAAENLVVLIGTQPVDDELLPNRLLQFSPKVHWQWLPSMTGNSIYEYLNQQLKAGRLFTNCDESHSDSVIRASASAMLGVTKGYPLHVIYSVEYLSIKGKALTDWEIEKLPPCMDGNIANYYADLWRGLNYKQRDVLHLCSGFQFAWPRNGVGKVVSDEHSEAPSVDAVAHMLSEGFNGVRPFHESLVVFVKNQEEHERRVNELLPGVCDWLSNLAPPYLKDNWLWSSQAKAGNSNPLRQGVNRDWILDRVTHGMPVDSFLRLLSEAEYYAFEDNEYSEAYKHRELKMRLANGPKFQTWDSTNLEILSTNSADSFCINEALSRQNEYSPIRLSILAISLWEQNDIERAQQLSRKAISRYSTNSKLMNSSSPQDDENETVAVIKAGVLTDSLNFDSIFDKAFIHWSDKLIKSFRDACCTIPDIDLLMRAWKVLPNNHDQKRLIELDVIRLSILENAEIGLREESKEFLNQGLLNFIALFSESEFPDISTAYLDEEIESVFKVKPKQNYSGWFFSSINLRLSAEGDFCWLPIDYKVDGIDTSPLYELLNHFADAAAFTLNYKKELSFDFACTFLDDTPYLDKSTGWESQQQETLFRRDWVEISADCHLVTCSDLINDEVIKNILANDEVNTEWLRLWYLEQNCKLMTDTAAEYLIEIESNRLLSEVGETIDRSNTFLELARIAQLHNLTTHFEKCLRLTWDFVLGYIHHKDPTIFDVLHGIDYLSDKDPKAALNLLERVSPTVFNISEFTDGDETRHAKTTFSKIIAKLNLQTAASIYDHRLGEGEWYYADQTLLHVLEHSDFSNPIIKHLFLTGLSSECVELLKQKQEAGDTNSIDIVDQLKRDLGLKFSIADEKVEAQNELDSFGENITLNLSDYPPKKYNEIIAALKGKFSTSGFWKNWYEYWVSCGQEAELVKVLIPDLSEMTDDFDDRRYLLDMLFESHRRLSGKNKAFKTLVAAHKGMNGWANWYESTEASLKRLKKVAELYPNRINEFIKDTSKQRRIWDDKLGNLIIPGDKLVYLFSQANKVEEASKLSLEMIEALERSLRNIQLTKPIIDWESNCSSDELLLKVLISRVKIPVSSVKMRTIEILSSLLQSKLPGVETLLINDLQSRLQESEVVEALSIFYFAKIKGYIPPSDLGLNIKARSILSDLILKEFNQNSASKGNYIGEYLPYIEQHKNNNDFSRFQGTHVPLIYYGTLERIENTYGLPLTSFYVSEWNNTFDYQPAAATSVDYFFGGGRTRNTGQFYTQASHRGRSAYLRTIEIAKRYFDMPDSYAESLSILALPIEPAYIGLNFEKPTWIKEWIGESEVSKEVIQKFIETIVNEFSNANPYDELLAFSFPIMLKNNEWIDLTLQRAFRINSYVDEVLNDNHGVCTGKLFESSKSYKFNDSLTGSFLAQRTYPLDRHGSFYIDIESRGLYAPKFNLNGKKLSGTTVDGKFTFDIDGKKIGRAGFWFNNWQPTYPKGVRSLCGTYTSVNKSATSEWLNFTDSAKVHFYSCEANILSSKNDYSDLATSQIFFEIINDSKS